MNFFLRRLLKYRDRRLLVHGQLVLVKLPGQYLTFGEVVDSEEDAEDIKVKFGGPQPHKAYWLKSWYLMRMVDQSLTLGQWLRGLFPYMPEEPLHRSDSVAFCQTPSAKAMVPGTRVIWLTESGWRARGTFCRRSFAGHYVVRLDHLIERVFVVRQVVLEEVSDRLAAQLDAARAAYVDEPETLEALSKGMSLTRQGDVGIARVLQQSPTD